MKTSSPVRRGDCGKVPGLQKEARQLATFPPYLDNLTPAGVYVGRAKEVQTRNS